MITICHKFAVAILFIVSALALVCIDAAVADDALANQFLKDAPQKWQEYKSLLRGFDSTGEHTTEFVPLGSKGKGEKQSEHETDQVILDASAENALMKRGPEVNVANKDYYFTIRQTDPPGTKSFSLLYLGLSSLRQSSKLNTAARSGERRVGTIWQLYPLDLRAIVHSSDFKVRTAKEVHQNGESAVQIDFEYHSKKPEPFQTYTGSVRLSPKMYWAVLEGTLTVDDPKKQIGRYELNNRLGKFGSVPVVVGLERRTYDPDHNWLATESSKYLWSEFNNTASPGDPRRTPDIFRLSGYGF